MKFEDIKKLHQKKFREELGALRHRRRTPGAGAREGRGARCAPAPERDLRDARLRALVEHAADARHQVEARWRRSARRVRRRASPRWCRCSRRAAPQPGERAVYLHEIQDPGNLGTILRTLAWFGNFRCLLSPDSVDVHNGKVVRASMGAIFHVPVEIDVPLEALPAALRAHRLPGSQRASRLRRRRSGTSIATCSATKRAACRASSMSCAGRAGRSPFRDGRHRIAERRGDGEHLPVRAQSRYLTPSRCRNRRDKSTVLTKPVQSFAVRAGTSLSSGPVSFVQLSVEEGAWGRSPSSWMMRAEATRSPSSVSTRASTGSWKSSRGRTWGARRR